MLRTIKKRIVMLGNRMPFAPEKQKFFEDAERLDWIYNNLILEGFQIPKSHIQDMLDGSIPENISIEEPIMVEALRTLFGEMYYLAEKDIKPSVDMMGYFNHLITGDDKNRQFRKISAIVYQWDYSAIHPAEIHEKIIELEEIFVEAEKVSPMTEECFQVAEKIHNKIIEILPYGQRDALLARVMTSYYFMEKGYPAVAPHMKEQEYNDNVTKYLKTQELQGIGELYKKEILGHLDLMIQLTEH